MVISRQAHKILNDPERIMHRNLWFKRLEHLFDNEPDAYLQQNVFAVDGILGISYDRDLIYTDPEAWVVESLENLAENIDLARSDLMFKPACMESALFGVHFTDKIFGADVFFQDDQWYNRPLPISIGSLLYPDLEENPVWTLAKRVALAFVEQDVCLPLFGLPTIASALNIGVNLFNEEILAAMLSDPEAAAHDLAVINRLLCDMHTWYRRHIPVMQLQPVISWNRTQPPGYGQLCGCTTQLVSSGLYRAMVSALDDALLAVYPNGGMIHLCGAHTHLISVFRDMPHLRAIQINDRAAADIKKYFEGLRSDQVIYLNPCEEMSIEEGVAITGGKRLVIAQTIGAPIKPGIS